MMSRGRDDATVGRWALPNDVGLRYYRMTCRIKTDRGKVMGEDNKHRKRRRSHGVLLLVAT